MKIEKEEIINEMETHDLINVSKDIEIVESILQSKTNNVEEVLESI